MAGAWCFHRMSFKNLIRSKHQHNVSVDGFSELKNEKDYDVKRHNSKFSTDPTWVAVS